MKNIGFLALCLFFFLEPAAWATKKTLVLSIEKKEYAGEIDQRKGVVEALQSLSPNMETETISLNEQSAQQSNQIIEKINNRKGPVLLLSGHTFGPGILQEICEKLTPERRARTTTVLTGHQMWDGWEKLSKQHVDIVALPQHVATGNWQDADKPRLIKTVGVSHGLSPEKIEEAFQTNQETSLRPWKTDKVVLLVVLGGDVQKTDKTWARYTPQEAEKLADLVNQVKEERSIGCIIVTNGPRTGRISEDNETDAQASYHHLDSVTKAFTQKLSEKNITYTLENFVFGQPSSFSALLGLVNKTKGVIFVPGESTSMISQSIDSVTSGSVMVFNHSAMKDVHTRHVETENASGRAEVWYWEKDNWKKQEKSESGGGNATKHATESAAKTIARAISGSLKRR